MLTPVNTTGKPLTRTARDAERLRDRSWLRMDPRSDQHDGHTQWRQPVTEHVKNVGHNIDHHLGSDAFHQRQLDFAESVAP